MHSQTETSGRPTVAPKTVSFLNLRKLNADLRAEFAEALLQVVDQAAFIGGAELNRFEKTFADWVLPGSHVVGVANGTDSLTLAAKALKLEPGAEAIVPAMTYIATAAGVKQAGLKLKLVDVSPGTWLMDLDALEKAITPNTRLIVPVHLYGQMAAMDRVHEIARARKIAVMEDAAQAHGAKWKGKAVGELSDIASYSFYPGKNLGGFGDGGAILSRNAELIQLCRAFGNQGGIKKYEHDYVGYNSRLDNLQAAVLNVKMKYIDKWNEARRKVAQTYRELLSDISEIQLPVELADSVHVYHLYVITVPDREKLAAFLKEKGVESGVHYPRAIHHLPAFASEAFAKQSFPNAEKIAAKGLSLPMCPTLTTDEVKQVANSVRAFFGKNAR